MKSAKRGKRISAVEVTVEVTNVSKHGFWLLIGDVEYFAPFDLFPWFRNASIGTLTNVELPSPHHLHWPDLDIDLSVESLTHPEQFPLVSAATSESVRPAKRRVNSRKGVTSRR